MGLLDKLTKKGLSSLKDSLEKAAGAQIDRFAGQSAGTQQGRYSTTAPAQSAPRQNTQQSAQRDIYAYFSDILSAEFPEYQTVSRIQANEMGFGAAVPAKAYDFALSRNGICSGVIMLTPHNRDNNAAFKNAKAAALGAGVPFINFYTHFPNERGYVVQRIKSYLA